MTAVTVLARTESLCCIDALAYLLSCHIVVMSSWMLILLEMVNLLVLAICSTDCLFSITDSLLENDVSSILNIWIIALVTFVHVLEIVWLSDTLGLDHHTSRDVLVLAGDALVSNVGRCLSRLPHSELEQFLYVFGWDLGRCALTYLNDLTLRVVVRLWHVLLDDSRCVVWSVVHLVGMMRAMSSAWTLPRGHHILLLHRVVVLDDVAAYLAGRSSSLRPHRWVFVRVSLARLVRGVPPEEISGFGIWFRISLHVGVWRCHHGHILLIFEIALGGLTKNHLIGLTLHVDSRTLVRHHLLLIRLHRLLLVWILKNRKVINLSILLCYFLRVHLF